MMPLLVFLLRVFIVLGTIAMVAFGVLVGFAGNLDTYFAQTGMEQLTIADPTMRIVRAVLGGVLGLAGAALTFGALAAVLDIRDKLVEIRNALTKEPAWQSKDGGPMQGEKS